MLTHEGIAEVEGIIRDVAKREITPRFRHLAATDIAEKSPGDPVTVADRASEAELTRLLTAFLPGSVVVGEEAVAEDQSVLALLDGPDPVWVIDPIDGTRNFVAGDPHYSTLVALAQGGEILASWTHAPELDLTATALKGHGARINGETVRIASVPRDLKDINVAISGTAWWSSSEHGQFGRLRRSGADVSHYTASGIEYVDVAAGRRTALVLTWEHCWDHAAGILLVAEAGGITLTADMVPFRLSGGNALPFIAAADVETLSQVFYAMAATEGTP